MATLESHCHIRGSIVVRGLSLGMGFVLLVAVVAGCGGDNTESPEAVMTLPGGEEIDFAGFGPAGGDEWPTGIPEDIPVLPGEITNVMSDGGNVRMFYNGVSDETLLDYIAGLESLGYDLEYIVYETPGSGDRAQERAEAGEWDAVRASKDGYQIKLEFGGGGGTLDISGLPDDAFTPDLSWPAAWTGIPAPTQLEIIRVMDFGMGTPIIEVGYEDDDDVFAYAEELEAAGFETINRSFDQNHELISIVVRNDDHEVTLRTYPGGRLEITRMDPSESLLQPSPQPGDDEPGFSVVTNEFPDWLPEVPGGDVSFATEDPNGGFTASVLIGEGHSVAEYVQILNDAGYVEADTMLMGYVLSDGERIITIFGDDGGMSPLSVLIQVAGE